MVQRNECLYPPRQGRFLIIFVVAPIHLQTINHYQMKTRTLFYHSLLVALLAGCFIPAPKAKGQAGKDYVKKMHSRYHNNWYKTLTFTQETGMYRNDSLTRTNTWYEMVRFPFELRIDVDSINGGNKTFYKKDSTYRIRNNKIVSVAVDPNPFIFFLGGMYMLPLDSVYATLNRNGYDLSLGAATTWQGRKGFMIGAATDKDTSRNQFWIDAEHLYVVRTIVKIGNAFYDVHLSGHQKLNKGWSETEVRFYRNGQLLQVEKYRDIKADVLLTDEVFDVSRFR